jgi:hypothetical protein
MAIIAFFPTVEESSALRAFMNWLRDGEHGEDHLAGHDR